MSGPVILRPMRPDEFDAYMDARDREYAHSLTATMSPDAAWDKAKADRQRFLPQGLATEGCRLLFAENADGEVVGSVWLGLTDPRTGSPESAWLFDIRVEPTHRREGYATAMLRAVESLVRELGVDQLALNVFGANAAAISLYQAAGYSVSTQQMFKRLRGADDRQVPLLACSRAWPESENLTADEHVRHEQAMDDMLRALLLSPPDDDDGPDEPDGGVPHPERPHGGPPTSPAKADVAGVTVAGAGGQ